jgi:hypothetical protein
MGGAAEDHGAHFSVADGQGIGPQDGGFAVPEGQRGLLRDGGWRRGEKGQKETSR